MFTFRLTMKSFESEGNAGLHSVSGFSGLSGVGSWAVMGGRRSLEASRKVKLHFVTRIQMCTKCNAV